MSMDLSKLHHVINFDLAHKFPSVGVKLNSHIFPYTAKSWRSPLF